MAQKLTSLQNNLARFHHQYWRKRLLLGSFKSILWLFSLGIFFVTLEYFAWLSSLARGFLFYFFLVAMAMMVANFCAKSIFNLTKKFNKNDYLEIAKQVGAFLNKKHADEIINILQLSEQKEFVLQAELTLAAIVQKEAQIAHYQFDRFISIQNIKRPVLILLIGLICVYAINSVSPKFIQKPVQRIIHYSFKYTKDLPFQFLITNKTLNAFSGEPFELKVKLIGENLPSDVYVNLTSERLKMVPGIKKNEFSILFPIINQAETFQFEAGGYFSEPQLISIIYRPGIEKINIKLVFPSYMKRSEEVISQLIPLKIPEGTRVVWSINPSHAQKVEINFAHFNQSFVLKKSRFSKIFTYEKTINQSDQYRIGVSNQYLKSLWTESQTMEVIQDAWPTIDVEKISDTLYERFVYFRGKIADDYGISSLKFFFQIRENNQVGWQKINVRNIIIPSNKLLLNYDYIFRIDSLQLKPESEIQYFFEVSDNDALHGFKKTKTRLELWKFPDITTLNKQVDSQLSNLENQLGQTLIKAQDLKSELSEAMKRAQLGKDLNDQTRKEIAAKEKSLRDEIEQLKAEQQKWMGKQFSLQKPTESWIQKMEDLQKMIDQLWNPSTEKEADKTPSNWQNHIEQKQVTEKNRELELKRLEQFYKNLKKDQVLEKSIQELQNLSQKEKELSQKPTTDPSQQQEIFKNFQEEKKQLDAIEQEKESDQKEIEILENEVQNELEKVNEAMQEKADAKRKEAQKQAAEKMRKLAQKLESQRDQEESMTMDLNLNKLRLLVDDLLKVSFEQEKLMKDFSKITELGPILKNASQRQIRLSETAMVLEDSLLILGKRLMPLSQKITKETGEMRGRMNEASKFMKERKWPMVMARQQQAMAATNQLAVMLSDLIQQIQNQQMQSKPGKKGKSKPKPQGSWASRQKKLNDRTKASNQQNQSPMSEEMIKIAQEQAKIRQELAQKLLDLQNENDAKGLQQNLRDLIDAMEKNETDLVNKKLGKSLQERQEQLLPKLLESEKALKEQGEDPKRESKNAMEKWRESLPPNLKPFLKKMQENKSLYDQVPVELLPIYQQKVLKYLEQFRK